MKSKQTALASKPVDLFYDVLVVGGSPTVYLSLPEDALIELEKAAGELRDKAKELRESPITVKTKTRPLRFYEIVSFIEEGDIIVLCDSRGKLFTNLMVGDSVVSVLNPEWKRAYSRGCKLVSKDLVDFLRNSEPVPNLLRSLVEGSTRIKTRNDLITLDTLAKNLAWRFVRSFEMWVETGAFLDDLITNRTPFDKPLRDFYYKPRSCKAPTYIVYRPAPRYQLRLYNAIYNYIKKIGLLHELSDPEFDIPLQQVLVESFVLDQLAEVDYAAIL